MSYAFALYIAANPLHTRDVDVADVAHTHQYRTIGAIVVRNACIALIAALMILMIAVVTAMADGRVKPGRDDSNKNFYSKVNRLGADQADRLRGSVGSALKGVKEFTATDFDTAPGCSAAIDTHTACYAATH